MATATQDLVDRGENLKRDGIVIRTYDLWKTYVMGDQEIHAVSGVDIEIRRGEYVAIMGPSGSGKSTLMNLIGCLDSPTRGLYYLNGNLVSDMQDDELAHIRNKEIGFVFQTFNLLARASGLHNVELPLIYAGVPKQERAERAKAALRITDAFITQPDRLSDAVAEQARAWFGPAELACIGLNITKWSTQKIKVALGTDGADRLVTDADGVALFGFDQAGQVTGYRRR